MNKSKYILSIPEPCSENWEEMTPCEQGRFCASCQKKVIDFSNLTDQQIISIIKASNSTSLCGRLHTSQQNRVITEPITVSSSGFHLMQRIAAASIFFQSIATTLLAQSAKPKTYQQSPLPGDSMSKKNVWTIRGCVTDYATREPLSGVIVHIVGTNIKTTTSTAGTWFLEVGDNLNKREITLHADTPYATGSFIMDETVNIDTAISGTDILLYRYPVEKMREGSITWIKPLIESHTAGGLRIIEEPAAPSHKRDRKNKKKHE